jgi:glycogen operon protein
VDRLSAFFDLVQQDPVVSQVKLIAEPWDVGEGGYQVGNFPPLWSEWNGKYRDTVRDFWRGEPSTLPEFASRLSGSSDLYETSGRRPVASINFITCHDGFTLADLVSYDRKHNDANGEDNADGTDDNRSWNCGAEGPTTDRAVLDLRARQQRNLLATLFCSQGVPMLLAGDELGRTQGGSNNAYCQDNEVSWVDWDLAGGRTLLEFACELAAIRREHPVFRRRRFFRGDAGGDGLADIAWLTPSGQAMADQDWNTPYARAMMVFLNGDAITEPGPRGEPVHDDTFLILLSAHNEPVTFTLPGPKFGRRWSVTLDTAAGRAGPESESSGTTYRPGGQIVLAGHSMMLLRRTDPVPGQ